MKAILFILMLISTTTMAQLIIEDNVKFLALGDSYTIGESVTASERWPNQLTDSLSAQGLDYLDCKIIAVTGWRTDDLKEAIKKEKIKEEYSLVSLLIGVNNFYQGKSVESYKPEFEELLQTAIKLAGGVKTRVFVLSIPDYGFTPFGKKDQQVITKGIDNFNAVNESIAKAFGVKYINITDITRRGLAEPGLVAFDGLHPSGKMYSEWVERILREASLQFSKEKDLAEDEEEYGEDRDDEGR